MLSVKLAVRNLFRNRWRSGLTLAGIAVAVALMCWTLAFYDGWIADMVRGATAVEVGQVQVQTARYARSPRIYESLEVDVGFLDRIRSVPDVEAVSPRVQAFGLVGDEERSRVSRIIGVDPMLEAETTPVHEGIVEGRWLAASPRQDMEPREVVVGADLAQQLGVAPGAELVVFLEAADGSLGNELLEVVGIVRTGNTGLDRMAVYIHLADAQRLTALDGRANEIAVRTADVAGARQTAAAIAAALGARLGGPGEDDAVPEEQVVVRPWQEIVPALDQMLLLIRRSYWFTYLVIYAVAAVGILNTQRMSALERRREFGVLMAIGLRPGRMFRMIQAETLALGVAGALIGCALGFAVSWYHATAGFDLTRLTSQASFSYMGVAFRDRLYFDLSVRAVAEPFWVMLLVTLLSGLWPSWVAARIEPAPTIAGRT